MKIRHQLLKGPPVQSTKVLGTVVLLQPLKPFCYVFQLGKVDVVNKSCVRWKGTVDQYPSEPVFVSRPGATEEDDGNFLCFIFVFIKMCSKRPISGHAI